MTVILFVFYMTLSGQNPAMVTTEFYSYETCQHAAEQIFNQLQDRHATVITGCYEQ